MILNIKYLKNELFKKEVIDIFKKNILVRYNKEELKYWKVEDWEAEIVGILGFSLSNVIINALEIDTNINKKNIDWEEYIDKTLESFISGEYMSFFKNNEGREFLSLIKEFSKELYISIFAETDLKNKYKVVLQHVELEDGLTQSQILGLLDRIEDDNRGIMPIEFHEENSSAYGFITSSCYESLSYDKKEISDVITEVLKDWDNERKDRIYKINDEVSIYMSCFCKTLK